LVPVTAKLSRAFYDRFGDEIVTELVEWFNAVDATYRADLREVNELNFARFDAKLEQRVVEVNAKIDRVAAELNTKIDRVAAELNTKIDGVAAELHARIDRVVAEVNARISEAKVEQLRWMFVMWATLMAAILFR
jgi:DNA anti-recombination protein RmuC